MLKYIISISLAVLLSCSMSGKSRILEDFKPVCDSLDRLVSERTGVESKLTLKAVMKRGNVLDMYFTVSLSDIPWRYGDEKWFTDRLKELLPPRYRSYGIGRIYSAGIRMNELPTGELGFSGTPDTETYRLKKVPQRTCPIVEAVDGMKFSDGLEGRHIALWQSHGLYYDQGSGRWRWQRPRLFQTAEDLFTQSFVLPYLVPMLENAGAYVMLPRERDFRTEEIIVDNDPDFSSSSATEQIHAADLGDGIIIGATSGMRLHGTYSESGKWENCGSGFADAKAVYTGHDNPFTMGTARKIACLEKETRTNRTSRAVWTPEIPEKGEYAVYVSYKTLPNSSESAHYSVVHAGGKSEFIVNQKMGGGTWIYLGTFEFEKGDKGYVTLDNMVPAGRKFVKGTVVSADAVKIGGGMGNIARKSAKDPNSILETSGMPRFAEGARYWLQWAGMDSTVYSLNEDKNDYKDDFMSRGDWVCHMSGGSDINPKQAGRGIPFDLAFALHSDAGTTPNDSTIGTLAIYTLESEGSRKLPAGEDRRTSREYANLVQSQIVNDIRAEFDPEWNRRWLWNRGYRESRTPTSPAMLCELLSHQNFADMKYGHDPAFKFCVSRAIYKGMLKYLSNRYGCGYVVQPLPVRAFSANLDGNTAILEWEETADTLEPTARPSGFLLQTRIDGKGFSPAEKMNSVSRHGERYRAEIPIEPGHVYSFRISAWNSGGKSFPSEILSVGIPEKRNGQTDSCVLIVNNFNRVSAPAWFDSPEFAGFDNRIDSGVPYIKETAFIGEMFQFRRSEEWKSDDMPGFGASCNDFAGSVIAGNTFDYPYIHGKAVMECGYPFCSASSEAFAADSTLSEGKWCVDIICGKQVRTVSGRGAYPERFAVFPEGLRNAVEDFTAAGGNILISGANIGTDVWSSIYPVQRDSTERENEIRFAEKVLGFKWITGHAGNSGKVIPVYNSENFLFGKLDTLTYNNVYDNRLYRVENPDGLAPSCGKARTILRYSDTRISAGTCYEAGNYRTVCIGFPVEVILEEDAMLSVFDSSFKFFINGKAAK